MTVKEMTSEELLLKYVETKKNADYYYKSLKEIEDEMKHRYDEMIEKGRRENENLKC
ncbi:MAG: hypothetical protein N4A63_13465 [Vallitalea sp.]|jgi:hypothetical protein|nr:hypothetical protein [Vallitalea sp.]